jgi:glucuronate isomerase
MTPFIHEDFLLHSEAARRLFHQYAENEPILDYHCHLPVRDVAENRRFGNLYEIWLEGDHYKWRAMRANGVAEKYCTGDAAPFDKFLEWAETVPQTLRNPLYHWTHLELKRYFGIDESLTSKNAHKIWDEATAKLQSDELRPRGIFTKFKVRAICTTDDPTDDLQWHRRIVSSGHPTRVYPAFRPDKALRVSDTIEFNEWLDKLGEASGMSVTRLSDFLDALASRHDSFHSLGCRLSDHGLNHCHADFCGEREAAAIFAKARNSETVGEVEQKRFAAFMMLFFGQLDATKGWTKQLHLGAMRNASGRGMRALGPDTGFDSIGDWPQAEALAAYLDRLEQDGALPKTILYNLNPADNYAFAAMIGNFQDGSMAGKIQYGSAWWFLDQREAMQWQINALSNGGLLSRFIGMLTDSRSFMSYPRHEYFRRVLCNMLGEDMEKGELPQDLELIGGMVRNICFANARDYLGLDLPGTSDGQSGILPR